MVSLADGADRADIGDVQDDIATRLADHPDAKVLDEAGFEKGASRFIDQILILVTVMLLLASAAPAS